MDFDKIQEEGFNIKSFYNRLNNILCSYISNYTYEEYLDNYYKMICNIIYNFNNEEFKSEQDLYNKYNLAHQKIIYIYIMLKQNYLKEHNINNDIFINTNTNLNTYYTNLKRKKTILK